MQKIKKCFIISTIAVVILFQSCGVNKDSMGKRVIKDSEIPKEQYEEISGGEVKITEKLIIDIAESALRSYFHITEAGELHIHKVENENIYIVSLHMLTAKGEPLTIGGAYNVAISGENGAILKVWGEK